MRWGISGTPIPHNQGLPFALEIERAAEELDFPPCLAYGIKINETSYSQNPAELEEGANPQTGLLPNGDNAGHGIFQLTEWWPEKWDDPYTNAHYAIADWLLDAAKYGFSHYRLTGLLLVRFTAAAFNEGLGAACKYHEEGNVDLGTTNDYAARAESNFQKLIAGLRP